MRHPISHNRTACPAILPALLAAAVMVLPGCTATHTMIKKRNLDVQTRMSETIFLEPAAPADKIIYVSIKNTSDKPLKIKAAIQQALQAAGYTLTRDPAAARFMLQGNILHVGRSDMREAGNALAAGFGGAVAGATVAGMTGGSGRDMAGAGLLVGALSLAGDALVEDTLYSMVTDIQVRERPLEGETVTQSQRTTAAQGTATTLSQDVSGARVSWKTYRTRIVSTANKANLKFGEALPALEDGLIRSISGIFSD